MRGNFVNNTYTITALRNIDDASFGVILVGSFTYLFSSPAQNILSIHVRKIIKTSYSSHENNLHS